MEKEPTQNTPFNNQMIGLYSINKLTDYNNKFIEIQNGDNKIDIGYNDQEGIDNYKKLFEVDKLNISTIYDQSGNGNHLFQNNKTKQPKIDRYFEFGSNSEMNFINNEGFYNRGRFTIAIKVNLTSEGIIFSYGNQYRIEYLNGHIQFVLNDKTIHAYKYKLGADIFLAWTYLQEMQTSLIQIDNEITEIQNTEGSLGEADAIVGEFTGIMYSFGVWYWNLLKSQLSYIQSKF